MNVPIFGGELLVSGRVCIMILYIYIYNCVLKAKILKKKHTSGSLQNGEEQLYQFSSPLLVKKKIINPHSKTTENAK